MLPGLLSTTLELASNSDCRSELDWCERWALARLLLHCGAVTAVMLLLMPSPHGLGTDPRYMA